MEHQAPRCQGLPELPSPREGRGRGARSCGQTQRREDAQCSRVAAHGRPRHRRQHGTDGLGIRTGGGCSCPAPRGIPQECFVTPVWDPPLGCRQEVPVPSGTGVPREPGLPHAQQLPPVRPSSPESSTGSWTPQVVLAEVYLSAGRKRPGTSCS